MLSDTCLKYVDEEHHCPHCNTRLSCCHTPPFHVGDGLGWGSEIMFICLNDECSLFVNSWTQFEEQYGHSASCRYMKLPDENKGTAMMVGSKDAFTGSVIDPIAIRKQSERYRNEMEAVDKLATCVEENNLDPVLTLILDEHAKIDHRKQAADLLLQLNNLSCVDPIRNHSFKNTEIEMLVNIGIHSILKNHFKKECPHCAEIVKAKANICKECGKEVSSSPACNQQEK